MGAGSRGGESESPEAGPVLRLRARVVGAGPSGPSMTRQKPGAYSGALAAVLRGIRKPTTPDDASAKSGGVFSISPPDLFSSRRRAGASASVNSRKPLTLGAVKALTAVAAHLPTDSSKRQAFLYAALRGARSGRE